MGSNPDNMIKKAISEMIAEEMFKELGFYVLRIGQEDIVNPLTQLDWFIKKCGGKFKLKKDKGIIEMTEMSFFQKMPDLCIVDKEGVVSLIEVKFSRKGMLDKRKIEPFTVYPLTQILVINLSIGDRLVFDEKDVSKAPEISSSLRETRFHVWGVVGKEEGKIYTETVTLKDWLKQMHNIDAEKIIKKYEELVTSWLH